ncbi:MAG: hypothetical protein WC604_03945 [Candidatus Gracilibacteria bacterium]
MFKKLLTITLATLIALQLAAAAAATASAALAAPNADANVATYSTHPTANLLADNKLIIPKPDTLPGPGETQQGEVGGVKKWFTETILTGWAKRTIGFVGMIAFLMLVVSGVRYLTSYGNDEAATSAKKMIIYSLVALLLALFSYSIVYIIITFQFQ